MIRIIMLLISLYIYSLTDLKRTLMVFQQNHYEPNRQIKWLIKEKIEIKDLVYFVLKNFYWIIIVCLYIFIFSFPHQESFFTNKIIVFINLYFDNLIFGLMIIIGIIRFIIDNKRKYIKPLVYTNRVKRQLVVLFVLYSLLSLLVHSAINSCFLCLFSIVVANIMIFVMFYILEPLEIVFRNKFINEAKNILKEQKELIRIGITGSYGKTTTKNIVQNILSDQYYSYMTPASYNTPLGITKCLRENLKPIHEVFVCEMGADKINDIDYLMNFVKPQYGIVTSIGPQHLNTFKSIENIIHEKMLMIEKLPSNGVGFINYDNEYIRNYRIKNNCRVVKCAIDHDDVDYQAIDIKYTNNGSSFKIKHNDEIINCSTRLLGRLNVINIVIAVALAKELRITNQEIEKSISRIEKVEHRLEPKIVNGYHFIDDAFNANPVGSLESLEVLKMMDNTRWIVTPGMIDLGTIEEETNYKFGSSMKEKVDKVILVGKHQTKAIYQGLKDTEFDLDNVFVVDTIQQAFDIIYKEAKLSDTILLENDLPDAFSR